MDKVTTITHKGREISFTDLSDTINTDRWIDILDQAEEVIKAQPPKSVLSLIDYTNAHFDFAAVEAQKNYSAAVTPHIKASAVVGLNSLMMIILRSIIRLTGREIRVFNDSTTAKDWLVKQ